MKRSPMPRSDKPMKRTAMPDRTERMERRTRIKQESDKRRAERKERASVREVVLARDRYTCQAAGLGYVALPPCGGALEVDEPKMRSRRPGAKLHLDPDECLTLCHDHHRWKHDNPVLARLLGLEVASTTEDGMTAPERVRKVQVEGRIHPPASGL